MSISKITITGDSKALDELEKSVERIQIFLGILSKANTLIVAASITEQILMFMLAKGLPLGFYDETTEEFTQVEHDVLDNLVKIAKENK